MWRNDAQILMESLEKKNRVLDAIIRENEVQEKILKAEELDMDALDTSTNRLGELAEQLERLDDGFEALYDRIREELMANKDSYRDEIARMQTLIGQITDKVVKINAARMRNERQARKTFQKARDQIGKASSQVRASRSYFNNMNRLNYVEPQFYDNKK